MARIVVGSPNLTQPLLLYPGLEPVMLEQHRRSFLYAIAKCKMYRVFINVFAILTGTIYADISSTFDMPFVFLQA
jgi:hypothetical protein